MKQTRILSSIYARLSFLHCIYSDNIRPRETYCCLKAVFHDPFKNYPTMLVKLYRCYFFILFILPKTFFQGPTFQVNFLIGNFPNAQISNRKLSKGFVRISGGRVIRLGRRALRLEHASGWAPRLEQARGWALQLEHARGWALQLEQTRGWALRLEQTWEISDLGSCPLENTLGKLPHGNIPLGKYLT